MAGPKHLPLVNPEYDKLNAAASSELDPVKRAPCTSR
jgi:hypothetical protein